jgi:hypothetical protein
MNSLEYSDYSQIKQINEVTPIDPTISISNIMEKRKMWSNISKGVNYPRPQGHLPMYEYGIKFPVLIEQKEEVKEVKIK